jgi:divalent metal cation (Fe/Co/Zn/Cd) transporter
MAVECVKTGQTTSSRTIGVRRAMHLASFTVGYNILEGLVSLVLGHRANSIALVGFGLDSFVESASGLIVLWRFEQERRGGDVAFLESRALRWIGYSFFVLAAYVTAEGTRKLWTHDRPESTVGGIILALVSLVVMPVLAYKKRQTGRSLESVSLVSDSKQTIVCSLLSLTLLTGLALNAWLGWWWCDPVAGICMVPWLIREGRAALSARRCC